MMTVFMQSDDRKCVNCAECRGFLMVGDDNIHRIKGRPYCDKCVDVRRIPAGHYGPLEDESPWQSNAIRCMEG